MITCPDIKDQCDQGFIRSNCPYTCGVCQADPNVCSDHNMDCVKFSGLCNSGNFNRQCPRTCGLCGGSTSPDCMDHLVSCPMYSKPCSSQVALECPQTCGECDGTVATVRTTVPTQTKRTTVPTTTVPTTTRKTTKAPCKDASPNCPTWSKNGFCTNTFYPPEKRKEYCAKTCKFC